MIRPDRLRPWLRDRLRPLLEALVERDIRPDGLTLAGLAVAAAAGALLAVFPTAAPVLWLLPLAVLARLALDSLDGLLARERGLASPRGALLNEVAGGVGDLLLYLPVALVPGVAATPVVLLVGLGLCAEIAGLATAAAGAERRRDGPLRKTDRALLFALVGLVLALDPDAAPWLPWLLLPALALAALTIGNRLRAGIATLPSGLSLPRRGPD